MCFLCRIGGQFTECVYPLIQEPMVGAGNAGTASLANVSNSCFFEACGGLSSSLGLTPSDFNLIRIVSYRVSTPAAFPMPQGVPLLCLELV